MKHPVFAAPAAHPRRFNILYGSRCVEAALELRLTLTYQRFNILYGSRCVEAGCHQPVALFFCKVSISSTDRDALKPAAGFRRRRAVAVSISSTDRDALKHVLDATGSIDPLGFNILYGSRCVEAVRFGARFAAYHRFNILYGSRCVEAHKARPAGG